MTEEQPHAYGSEAENENSFRGLCWCGWRGEWRDSARIARRDAVTHVKQYRQVTT